MSKIATSRQFEAFIKDAEFWKNWELVVSHDENEDYFLNSYSDVHAGKPAKDFDFSKTSVTLLHVGGPNNMYDGEHISYFFELWMKGERF